MRRSSVLLISLLVSGLFLSPASAQPPPRLTISVMNLKAGSDISFDCALVLTDRLLVELARTTRFDVTERSRRDEILREQAFQQTGACDEASCLSKIGKFLGVQKMVGGTIGKIGDTYSVNLRMVDVESGRISQTAVKDYVGNIDYLLTTAMSEVAWELAVAGLTAKQKEELLSLQPEIIHKRQEEERLAAQRRADSLAVVQRATAEAESLKVREVRRKEAERLAELERQRKKQEAGVRAKRGWAWATLVLGVGSVVGTIVEESNAGSNYQKYKDATTVETMNQYKDKVKKADMVANICLGASGVFIGTSGLLFLTSRGGGSPHAAKQPELYLGLTLKGQPNAAFRMRF